MAIKGSLKEASLPDVLQLLALGQKTGCLSIADRSNFGYIYFDKGRICFASIVNRRDRLGDILVKHGKITPEQLDAGVHRQGKEHGRKLGEILVAMGVISQADLERYMRVQIEESVYYLFTWTQGTFNFEAEVRPERQDFLVSINPESLLLEGARREPRDRGFRARRVRDRQSALRADHRGVRPPHRPQRVGRRRPGHGRACRGAPQLGYRVLQDGDAGRGDTGIPPRGGAAAERGAGALLHRARGAAPGAVARGDGGAAPRRGEGGRPPGGVSQPRLRLRAARPAWRGGRRLRRGGGAGQDRSEGLSRLGHRRG